MKIGVFDSGMGGLSVLHRAIALLPNESFIYYADEKNVPYGEKTRDEVIRFTDEAVDFMVKKGVGAVVIACNTATSCAIRYLREKYGIPFVGMEPAVKPAVEICERCGKNKRVLVTATPLTVREEKLHSLLLRVDENHLSDLLALPKLVRFAESHEFSSAAVKEYITKEFSAFDTQNYAAVVLGCTHFNYFKDTIATLIPHGTAIVDGCDGTVKHLIGILRDRGLLTDGGQTVEYYFSGRAVTPLEAKEISELHVRLSAMERITHGA